MNHMIGRGLLLRVMVMLFTIHYSLFTASAQQKEKKELTPEEKEAEALMRQVERRQKDAAEMRAFIRNALKKREKSGKDW